MAIEGNYCIDLIMNWLAVKTCDEWVVAAAGLVVGVIGFVCTIISFCFLLVVGVIGFWFYHYWLFFVISCFGYWLLGWLLLVVGCYWLFVAIGCCLVVCVVGEQAAVLFPALQVVTTVSLVDTYPWM